VTQWALLSGIRGNLVAYEAVLRDISRQDQSVEQLFILGDSVGLMLDSEALVARIQDPKSDELSPQICRGWWEEQALILYGLGATGDPVELRESEGAEAVERLWRSVSHATIEWIQSLDFGFQELDCLMIHGSTVSVSDSLTPDTPPLRLLDRVVRADVNHLFCGRSGLTFRVEIQSGSLKETLETLETTTTPVTKTVHPKQVVGVGSVGRIPGQATYTLYDPGSGDVDFRRVEYRQTGSHARKGFGR